MSSAATWASIIGLIVYFLGIVVLVGMYGVNLLRTAQQKRMMVHCERRLPCGRCVYFTGELRVSVQGGTKEYLVECINKHP